MYMSSFSFKNRCYYDFLGEEEESKDWVEKIKIKIVSRSQRRIKIKM